MKSYNIIVKITAEQVAQLEELAWENEVHCITHQPPSIDAWPGEIHELPTDGEVVSVFSFETEKAALSFQAILKKTGKLSTELEIEEILPWIEYHKPFMQPIQLGYLTILPQEPSGQLADNTLYLPAGLAFGTGQHATTRSCLLLMQEIGCHHHDIIDFGCGSGILGLAALILGARSVQAHDHDSQALQATTAHAHSHGLTQQVKVIPNPKDLKDCSVLCANILFEPLITLRDDFIKYIRPHGYGIFAGILQTQANDFKKYYQDSFYILQEITDDGWTSFLLQKRH
ncbi:hypothetical protein EBR43_00385 [bacterium]|nr:hypothetical protein [bacterium]NBX72335.1 hypothetical protein [bacterium]